MSSLVIQADIQRKTQSEASTLANQIKSIDSVLVASMNTEISNAGVLNVFIRAIHVIGAESSTFNPSPPSIVTTGAILQSTSTDDQDSSILSSTLLIFIAAGVLIVGGCMVLFCMKYKKIQVIHHKGRDLQYFDVEDCTTSGDTANYTTPIDTIGENNISNAEVEEVALKSGGVLSNLWASGTPGIASDVGSETDWTRGLSLKSDGLFLSCGSDLEYVFEGKLDGTTTQEGEI